MWSLFDLRQKDGGKSLEWVCELPEDEATDFIEKFRFVSSYSVVQMAKSIAIKNGIIYKHHMQPDSINAYHQEQVDDIVVIANQQALNYATSIKTFLDWTERELRITNKLKELEDYQQTQRIIYDSQVSYRFWMRLRNFLVHHGFPYTSAVIAKTGIHIQCSKEHLLTFSNWNTVKADIEQMPDVIELHDMVPAVNACIQMLYLDFLKLFGNEIITAMKAYSAFSRKYGVKQPMFSEHFTAGEENADGFSLMPVPVGELMNAFSDLRKHPGVKIDIVK